VKKLWYSPWHDHSLYVLTFSVCEKNSNIESTFLSANLVLLPLRFSDAFDTDASVSDFSQTFYRESLSMCTSRDHSIIDIEDDSAQPIKVSVSEWRFQPPKPADMGYLRL